MQIDRHKTAITRTRLSAPTYLAIKLGYIRPGTTVLDYGCGKGSDVRFLSDSGILAMGYDPYFIPYTEEEVRGQQWDVVLLNFVLNTIEDPRERRQCLLKCFDIAKEALIVAVRPLPIKVMRSTKYGDGIITSKNTFQKAYSCQELEDYVTEVTGVKPRKIKKGVVVIEKGIRSE